MCNSKDRRHACLFLCPILLCWKEEIWPLVHWGIPDKGVGGNSFLKILGQSPSPRLYLSYSTLKLLYEQGKLYLCSCTHSQSVSCSSSWRLIMCLSMLEFWCEWTSALPETSWESWIFPNFLFLSLMAEYAECVQKGEGLRETTLTQRFSF